jgi:phosphate transport system substrate-binding protein
MLPSLVGVDHVGLTAMIDGTTDIAMASRDLKTEEKLKFAEMKKRLNKLLSHMMH